MAPTWRARATRRSTKSTRRTSPSWSRVAARRPTRSGRGPIRCTRRRPCLSAARSTRPRARARTVVALNPGDRRRALVPRRRRRSSADRTRREAARARRGVLGECGRIRSAHHLRDARYRMVALDAKTGAPIKTFGESGVVDLKRDNDQELDLVTADLGLNATPLVAGDVVVVGAAQRFSGSPRTMKNARGYVRGYDVRTGKRSVDFSHDSDACGEFGYDTWLDETALRETATPAPGRSSAPTSTSGSSTSGGDADRRLLRREPAREDSLRRKPGGARHQDGDAQVALSDDASRHLGLRPAVRPCAVRRGHRSDAASRRWRSRRSRRFCSC